MDNTQCAEAAPAHPDEVSAQAGAAHPSLPAEPHRSLATPGPHVPTDGTCVPMRPELGPPLELSYRKQCWLGALWVFGNNFALVSGPVSQQGAMLPPRGYLLTSGDILVVTAEGATVI